MTDEQRRFKIQKKEEYKKLASQESKQTVLSTILLGLGAAGAICGFNLSSNVTDVPEYMKIIGLAVEFVSASGIILSLKSIINSICKKTKYEGKADEIMDELEMDDIEKKGMKL